MGKHDAPRGSGQREPRPRWPGPDAWPRRIARTFAAGLSVVRQHPELWALPVLAVIAAAGVGAAGAWYFPAYHGSHQSGWADNVALAVVSMLVAVVLMLGNIALVQATDQVLRGGTVNPFSIGAAKQHWPALARCVFGRSGIGVWVLVFGVLTAVTGPTDWATYISLSSTVLLLGGSSTVKESYLLPPIIVIEGLRYGEAQERLTALVRQTWRGADGATGLVLAGLALYLPVLAIVLGAVWITSGRIDLAGAAERPALLIVLGWAALIWVLTCAVKAVYRIALYRYAVEGVALPPYAAGDLELAFGRMESA